MRKKLRALSVERLAYSKNKKKFYTFLSATRYPLSAKKGFTLIELMLVVIIIGVLVGMVMPRLVGKSEQAKKAVAQADIEANIASALELYEVDNGNFPTSDQGLTGLRSKPSGNPVPKNWNGPYLKKAPLDPWGNTYVYKSPGEHNSDGYDLSSKGKDGIEGTEDDITNWEK